MSGTLTADATVAGKYTGTMTSAGSTKKFAKVDSKDTIVMFVNSDDSEGVTGLDYTNIDLAYAFDSDFCTTRSGKCTALMWRSLPRSHRSKRMKPRHMSRPSKRSRRDRTALRR